MTEYVKPQVLENDELFEGVYAASGSQPDCYTVTTNIHQRPETGRGDYRIQVNGTHAALDGHHSGEQHLIITFNKPVTYSGSNGSLVAGNGTNTLDIRFRYHNNGGDSIGMGDVIVVADAGLAVTKAIITCNHDCGQH